MLVVRERNRLVCPECHCWRWVIPRDEQNRWREPLDRGTLGAKVYAGPCPECGGKGKKIDAEPNGYRRFECGEGHRWSVNTTRASPRKALPRRFQTSDALLAAMSAMGTRRRDDALEVERIPPLPESPL